MNEWWERLTFLLNLWGRATHICVSKLTIIASDNGLSPGRRQAIIWSNAEILLIGLLGTDFGDILIEILIFPFTKMRLKVSSAKWRPFYLGLNVLKSSFPNGRFLSWPYDSLPGLHSKQVTGHYRKWPFHITSCNIKLKLLTLTQVEHRKAKKSGSKKN